MISRSGRAALSSWARSADRSTGPSVSSSSRSPRRHHSQMPRCSAHSVPAADAGVAGLDPCARTAQPPAVGVDSGKEPLGPTASAASATPGRVGVAPLADRAVRHHLGDELIWPPATSTGRAPVDAGASRSWPCRQQVSSDQQASHVLGGLGAGEVIQALMAELDRPGGEPVQQVSHVGLVEPDDHAVGSGTREEMSPQG